MVLSFVTPMPEEAVQIRASMPHLAERPLARRLTLLEGWLEGLPCRLLQTGIGKVAAASAVQSLLHIAPSEPVLLLGIAGGIVPGLHLGDIVVATQAVQHDLDPRPFFPRSYVPHLETASFPADPSLQRRAYLGAQRALARFHPDRPGSLEGVQPQIVEGLMLTGDQVISTQRRRQALGRAFPMALSVDMETAAVAQVCQQNDAPWGAVRIISDGLTDRIRSEQIFDYTLRVATMVLKETAIEVLRA